MPIYTDIDCYLHYMFNMDGNYNYVIVYTTPSNKEYTINVYKNDIKIKDNMLLINRYFYKSKSFKLNLTIPEDWIIVIDLDIGHKFVRSVTFLYEI